MRITVETERHVSLATEVKERSSESLSITDEISLEVIRWYLGKNTLGSAKRLLQQVHTYLLFLKCIPFVLALGNVLNTIFSFIYAPIGIIAQTGTLLYAIISVSNAFRESIQVEDVDKLAMYSSIVLTVVFAVPILTKIFVNLYEKRLGFILTHKPNEQRNTFQKFLDVINPYIPELKLKILNL